MSSSSKKFGGGNSPSENKGITRQPLNLSLTMSEESEEEQSPESTTKDMSISPPSGMDIDTDTESTQSSPFSTLRTEPLFELHYVYENLPTKQELLSILQNEIDKSSAAIKRRASSGEWYEICLWKDEKKPSPLSVQSGKLYVMYDKVNNTLIYLVRDPKNNLVEGSVTAWSITSGNERFGNKNFKAFLAALESKTKSSEDMLTPQHKRALLQVTTQLGHTLNIDAAQEEKINDVTMKLRRASKTSFTFDFAAKDVIFPPKDTSIPTTIADSLAYKVFAKNFPELQKNWLDAHVTRVELTINETSAGTVEISVKDNGKGFSERFIKPEEATQPKSYGEILYPPYDLQLLLQKETPSVDQLEKQGVALPALIKIDADPALFYLYGNIKDKSELTKLDNQNTDLLNLNFELGTIHVAENNENKALYALIQSNKAHEEKGRVSKIKSDKTPNASDYGGAGRGLSGMFSNLHKVGGDILIQNIYSPGDKEKVIGAGVTLVSPVQNELQLRKNNTVEDKGVISTTRFFGHKHKIITEDKKEKTENVRKKAPKI
ncbi:MAG: hypothetical protein ABI597_09565 [Gammaproteobacteria bacterium]